MSENYFFRKAAKEMMRVLETRNAKGKSFHQLFDETLDFFIWMLSHTQIKPNNFEVEEWMWQLSAAIEKHCEPFEDVLGGLYEEIAGRGHKSAMGQFFTPDNIALMMAQMVMGSRGSEENKKPQMFNEPSCGSGIAMLKLAQVLGEDYRRHLYVLQDLDITCVKMATIQMAWNGIPSVILHMNTLKVEAYRGYKVETAYTRLGTVPIIVQMSDKEVDDWSRMGLRKYKDEEPKQEQPKRIEEDKPKPTSVPEPSAMLFELEKIDKLEQKPKQVQKPKPKATKQDESQIKIDLFE